MSNENNRLRGLVPFVFVLLAGPARAQLDTFDYCVRMTPSPGLLRCAGQQALTSLQFLEEANNFTLANGLLMIKDESLAASSRIIPNIIDSDPLDFRGILENAGTVMAQRQMLWDMGIIYPGLKLKLGPTLGAPGVLEFVLDPAAQNDERSLFEEKSTGRRNFVVPFLLGLKFNLATLLPLVFGGLILLSKKALILGKIALFLSGMFGYGSLLTPAIAGFGGFGGYGGYGGGFSGHGAGGYGFGSKPFRYNNPLADNPDFDSHHQQQSHHQHHHHSSHHGDYQHGVSADSDHGSSGFYKKKDKFLNLDERIEPQQAPSLVDKFYEYEKQQMLKDRTARLFERKFYEKEHQPQSQSGADYPFVTADLTTERNERSLPEAGTGEGGSPSGRNFAWSEH
uniref:Protein osiris 10 n=1 Tax=Anopheles atroparvus TaxID=41427 RepID=A0AAG5D2Z3_ANOAO